VQGLYVKIGILQCKKQDPHKNITIPFISKTINSQMFFLVTENQIFWS